MRCKKCAYELGNAQICPACGTDQGHIKPPKKEKFKKKAFFLIKTTGTSHKVMVRNFIISIFLFFVALFIINNIETAQRNILMPIIILMIIFMGFQTFIAYKNPGIQGTTEYKYKARLSTGLIIFYVVFCLSREIIKFIG